MADRPLSFDDLRPGDRIEHASMGRGTVEKIDDHVHVLYDEPFPPARGRTTYGHYDRRWFEIYPWRIQRVASA